MCMYVSSVTCSKPLLAKKQQEVQLSQRDRATHYVSWNLNSCTVIWKITLFWKCLELVNIAGNSVAVKLGWLHRHLTEFFGLRKLESRGYRMALFAYSRFSRLSRTPTCNRQTGRRTDKQTHDDGRYRTSIPSRGWKFNKNKKHFLSSCVKRCRNKIGRMTRRQPLNTN